MRYVVAAVLAMVCSVAMAADIVDQAEGTIEKASCALAAAESTTGSTLIGGGAGALAGGLVGSAVGGKSGAGWGGLLGAGAGALLGANSGSKSYACRLLVKSKFGTQAFELISEDRYRAGEKVFVFKDADGKLSLF